MFTKTAGTFVNDVCSRSLHKPDLIFQSKKQPFESKSSQRACFTHYMQNQKTTLRADAFLAHSISVFLLTYNYTINVFACN